MVNLVYRTTFNSLAVSSGSVVLLSRSAPVDR